MRYITHMRFLWALIVVAGACGRDAPEPTKSVRMSNLTRIANHVPSDVAAVTVATVDGKPAPLAPHMRDVTVIAFWASWCHPCMEEMPHVDKLFAEETDPRVSVIAINLDTENDRPDALAAIQKLHLNLPVFLDPAGASYAAVFGRVSGTTIPALGIIAADGNELETGEQGMSDAEFVATTKYRIEKHLH